MKKFTSCTYVSEGYCQLGKRMTLGGYIGAAKGTGTESFTQSGNSTDAFGSFGGGFMGGVNFMYGKSKFIEFGGDMHAASVSKTNAKLSFLTLGPQVQVNILSSDKTVIPYVAGGLNLSFVGYKQNAYSATVQPPPSYYNGNSAYIPVTLVGNETPAFKMGINAALGCKLNAGVNVKLNTKFLGFAEAGFNSVFVNGNSAVKTDFQYSKGNFNYISFVVGVKINLVKTTGLY